MWLKLKASSQTLLIYRSPWPVIAFYAGMGLASFAFAYYFYDLMQNFYPVPQLLAQVISGLFALAGGYILLRLPFDARKILRDGGVAECSLSRDGLVLHLELDKEGMAISWDAVNEIILAEQLCLIEPGETSNLGRSLIVFVERSCYEQYAQRFIPIFTASGCGRYYLCVGYPAKQARVIESALQFWIPQHVKISCQTKVVFDTQSMRDY